MSGELKHSSHGPSSWERWIRCPASVRVCEGLPDSSGIEAKRGTCFHHYVALALRVGSPADCFVGAYLLVDDEMIEFDKEMAEFAKDGMDFIDALRAKPDWQVWIETRVDISPYTLAGQFGTADMIAVNFKERKVIIWDWKYGMESVYAVENYQLQGYALGAWETLLKHQFNHISDDIEVKCIIEQPRVPGAGGEWKTTMNRILEFGKHSHRQAAISISNDAHFHPGEKQCRWCPARDLCGHYSKWNEELIGLDLENDEGDILPDLETLPPERMCEIVRAEKNIMLWMKDLKSLVRRRAIAGESTPGLKLVEGRRPSRKWLEGSQTKAAMMCEAVLGDKAYSEPELLSPKQIEDAMGEENYVTYVKKYVDYGSPKAAIVVDKDTRPAFISVFESLEDI